MFGTSRIMNIIEKQKQKITPLYIIVVFVALSEGLFAYTISQTTSYLQIVLTSFAIFYAFGVTIVFFIILWYRPYVFYPPSEYPDANPKPYINAMDEALSPKKMEQIKLVSEMRQHPENKDAEYALIYNLLSNRTGMQLIILMYESCISLPNEKESECYCYFGRIKEGETIQTVSSISKISNIVMGLKYTKYLKGVDNNGLKVVLTEQGKKFAEWLVRNGKKSTYFTCEYGNWGNVPPDVLKQAKEDKRERVLK